MPRRVLALLLILTTLWSAAVQAAAGLAPGDSIAHAVLHWAGASHHHHDDEAGYHVDDSAESVQHVLADQAFGAPALPSDCFRPAAHAEPAVPHGHLASAGPAPFLDGPLRPPRQLS